MNREKYRKKLNQFKDYYMKTTILITILILFFLYILYETVFSYCEPAVSVLIICSGDMETEDLEEELEEQLDVGYVEIEQMTEGSNIERMLAARFVAGDIDLFIAEQPVFEYYAKKDVMEDLGECLEQELYDVLDQENRLLESGIQEETIDGTFVDTDVVKKTGVFLDENVFVNGEEGTAANERFLLGMVKKSGDSLFQKQAFEILAQK